MLIVWLYIQNVLIIAAIVAIIIIIVIVVSKSKRQGSSQYYNDTTSKKINYNRQAGEQQSYESFKDGNRIVTLLDFDTDGIIWCKTVMEFVGNSGSLSKPMECTYYDEYGQKVDDFNQTGI